VPSGGALSELAFSGKDAVVFRLATNDGAHIASVELATGAVETVARLIGATPGVACPSGTSGQIFFADESGNGISIFRAVRTAEGWTAQPFASPSRDDAAYVCPLVWGTP
jgi:hypothetical protein